ncbi:hypothetical protein [Azotobacter vinelandii]
MQQKELKAYQVGNNDIVAHYSPQEARAWPIDFAGYAEDDIELAEVELVDDRRLDLPVVDEEGAQCGTLRADLASATEPALLLSWE